VKIGSLLKDLIFEADPDADPTNPLSASFLMVWADAKCEGVSVWDRIATLTNYSDDSPDFLWADISRGRRGPQSFSTANVVTRWMNLG